jgi:hypothetical protein
MTPFPVRASAACLVLILMVGACARTYHRYVQRPVPDFGQIPDTAHFLFRAHGLLYQVHGLTLVGDTLVARLDRCDTCVVRVAVREVSRLSQRERDDAMTRRMAVMPWILVAAAVLFAFSLSNVRFA